jgi:hypothetical protein
VISSTALYNLIRFFKTIVGFKALCIQWDLLVDFFFINEESKVLELSILIENEAERYLFEISDTELEVHPLRMCQLEFYFLQYIFLFMDLAIVSNLNIDCLEK